VNGRPLSRMTVRRTHRTPRVQRHASHVIAAAYSAAIVAALAAAGVYVAGGQTQAEGLLLGAAIGSIGLGLVVWSKRLLPDEVIIQDRHGPSAPDVRADAAEAATYGAAQLQRRKVLVRLLLGAFGALGLAAVFPIRSLGPAPAEVLYDSPWRPGRRLVTRDGRPVPASRLRVGSVLTVFPEGAVSDSERATGQAMLVRIDPAAYEPRSGREDWIADGHLAFSKVCTHAGCPVGLYQASTAQLTCPCHRSTFQVTTCATVVFGPAGRPLPQLPLQVDASGHLVAAGGFSDAVGPAFWNLRPQ